MFFFKRCIVELLAGLISRVIQMLASGALRVASEVKVRFVFNFAEYIFSDQILQMQMHMQMLSREINLWHYTEA